MSDASPETEAANRDGSTDRASQDLAWDAVDGNCECGYCGRPFTREELLALHRGLAHADDLSPSERSAFEAAYESEQQDLRLFRLKALGALVVLYFGFLVVYAVL